MSNDTETPTETLNEAGADTPDVASVGASKKTDYAKTVHDTTGWKTTTTNMSVYCTKPGYGPVTFHCSSIKEAAELAITRLCDPNYVPLLATEAPKVTRPANEDADETAI